MNTTNTSMDETYRDAMTEHLAQLEEELAEIKRLLEKNKHLPALAYRACERTLQLLIEACIGIAKQTLKAKGVHVPSDARQVFGKLQSLGLDATNADWRRIVGMRNVLVHDYPNLEPARIIEVIETGKYTTLLQFAYALIGKTEN